MLLVWSPFIGTGAVDGYTESGKQKLMLEWINSSHI